MLFKNIGQNLLRLTEKESNDRLWWRKNNVWKKNQYNARFIDDNLNNIYKRRLLYKYLTLSFGSFHGELFFIAPYQVTIATNIWKKKVSLIFVYFLLRQIYILLCREFQCAVFIICTYEFSIGPSGLHFKGIYCYHNLF